MAHVTGLVPELSILHVLYQELQSKFTMPDKSYIQYGAGYVITKKWYFTVHGMHYGKKNWGHNIILCEELCENYVLINKQSATFNIISVLPLVFISDGKCRQLYAQMWL